jgi:hypothetical protein
LDVSRQIKWLERFGLFLLPIPIFLNSDFTFYKGETVGNSFPISICICAALFLTKIKYIRFTNTLDMLVLALLIWISINYAIFGLVINNSPPQIYLLYFSPMLLGYLCGRSSLMSVENVSLLIFSSLGIFSLLHISYGWATFGVSEMLLNQGSNNILDFYWMYDKYIYYPLMLGIVLFLSFVFSFKSIGLVKYALQLFILIEILVLAAREPFVMIVAMMFIFAFLSKKWIILVRMAIFLSILGGVYYLLGVDAPIVEKINNLKSNVSAGRADQINYFFEYSSNINFFIGESYTFLEKNAVGSFHNQWIDIYVKGGCISLLMYVFLYGRLFILFLCKKTMAKEEMVLMSIFAALFILSFQINTSLRFPYSAIIIWYLFGIFSRNISKSSKEIIEKRA